MLCDYVKQSDIMSADYQLSSDIRIVFAENVDTGVLIYKVLMPQNLTSDISVYFQVNGNASQTIAIGVRDINPF